MRKRLVWRHKPLVPALGEQRQEDLHSWRPALSTRQVPGQPRLHSEILSQIRQRRHSEERTAAGMRMQEMLKEENSYIWTETIMGKGVQ